MKKLLIVAICFGLVACAGKVVIPDEPQYKNVSAYIDPQFGGVCFPPEEMDKFVGNIRALKEYSEKLKGMLEKK